MNAAIKQSLIESFMTLGLTRIEAEIAATGPVSAATTTADTRGEIFEPIGRGGFREL